MLRTLVIDFNALAFLWPSLPICSRRNRVDESDSPSPISEFCEPADVGKLKDYWRRKPGKLTHDGKELANVEITVTPRFLRLLDYYGSKVSEDE